MGLCIEGGRVLLRDGLADQVLQVADAVTGIDWSLAAVARSGGDARCNGASLLTIPLTAASGPALAQAAMSIFGPGTINCAAYLNDRTIRINADGWILGFWTGANQ